MAGSANCSFVIMVDSSGRTAVKIRHSPRPKAEVHLSSSVLECAG